MQVYLLLTEKCNLDCRMCIRGSKNQIELSLSDLKNLNNLDGFENYDVVVTGGEPTLCKDFEPIIDFLSARSKSVTVCTNGIKNNYITQEFFKKNISIQISVDGTEKVHNYIRGNNTYSQTIETITKLEKLNIPYTIATVVSKKNVDCIFDLVSTLSSLQSLKHWSISYEMPFGTAGFNNMMTCKEWNDFVDELLDCVDFKLIVRKLFPFDLFEKYKNKLDTLLAGRTCYNCGSGKSKIYIYPDLTVYPCTCLTDFPIGNLKDDSLSNILNNSKCNIFSNYKVKVDSYCSNCEYLKFCNGGCIGMSYNYFKEIGCGDIRCPKLSKMIIK